MNLTTVRAFTDELEKIALTQEGVERIKKNVKDAKERGYSDVPTRSVIRDASGEIKDMPLTGQTARHTMKKVPFHEGVVRNLRATGRRMLHPKSGLRSFTKSFTNPASPKWARGLQAVGTAMTVANAAPKSDPTGQGESRIHRLAKGVGALAGGTIGKGWTGGLVGGSIGEKAGDLVGKGLDKIRGYKPPPPKADQ